MPYTPIDRPCLCCRAVCEPDERYCQPCIVKGCCVCNYLTCTRNHRNPCRADIAALPTTPTVVSRNGPAEIFVTGDPAVIARLLPQIEQLARNAGTLQLDPVAV